MKKIHHISNDQLTFQRIDQILKEGFKIELSEQSRNNIIKMKRLFPRSQPSSELLNLKNICSMLPDF